jgi:hypothetical protein
MTWVQSSTCDSNGPPDKNADSSCDRRIESNSAGSALCVRYRFVHLASFLFYFVFLKSLIVLNFLVPVGICQCTEGLSIPIHCGHDPRTCADMCSSGDIPSLNYGEDTCFLEPFSDNEEQPEPLGNDLLIKGRNVAKKRKILITGLVGPTCEIDVVMRNLNRWEMVVPEFLEHRFVLVYNVLPFKLEDWATKAPNRYNLCVWNSIHIS